jgi:uncharacterized membrane protein/protein-disulfide isomerase
MQPSYDKPDVGTSSVISCNATAMPSARFVWSLRIICVAALGISTYLAWTAFSMGNVFGCSGGDLIDCEHVLTSHWSKVMGIPVSVPAVGLYASLIALLAFARHSGPDSLRQMVWGGMTLGSVMAGLAALWFIGLQVFELKFCPYCLVVHTCGIVLAGTMVASRSCPLSLKLKSGSISVLGIAALVGIQLATPKADHFEIVRYDEFVPPAANNPNAVTEDGGIDVFAVPDAFEAPGEAFAAPGEVFEAPGNAATETRASETEDPAARNSVESGDSSPADGRPSVASALLLISPPRLLQLSNFLLLAAPQAADEAVKATDAVSDVKTEQPSSEPADDSAKASEGLQENDAATSTETTDLPAAVVPKPPERRLLTFAGSRFTLDIKQWPLLGKTDAKYVFVEMFDYTCPHCRNTHRAISGAQKQYGSDLAIFALPVPLENACNPTATRGGHPGACEMAKIAIAVWRLDPEKFQTFHDWMFQGQRTVSTARAFAETLVDKERLKTELSSDVPGQYISRHVSLYQRVGAGQVPKLIFPNTTMQGEVNSAATLCNTIQSELAVAKK